MGSVTLAKSRKKDPDPGSRFRHNLFETKCSKGHTSMKKLKGNPDGSLVPSLGDPLNFRRDYTAF